MAPSEEGPNLLDQLLGINPVAATAASSASQQGVVSNYPSAPAASTTATNPYSAAATSPAPASAKATGGGPAYNTPQAGVLGTSSSQFSSYPSVQQPGAVSSGATPRPPDAPRTTTPRPVMGGGSSTAAAAQGPAGQQNGASSRDTQLGGAGAAAQVPPVNLAPITSTGPSSSVPGPPAYTTMSSAPAAPAPGQGIMGLPSGPQQQVGAPGVLFPPPPSEQQSQIRPTILPQNVNTNRKSTVDQLPFLHIESTTNSPTVENKKRGLLFQNQVDGNAGKPIPEQVAAVQKLANSKVRALMTSVDKLKKENLELKKSSQEHKRTNVIKQLQEELGKQDAIIGGLLKKIAGDYSTNGEQKKLLDAVLKENDQKARAPARVKILSRTELQFESERFKNELNREKHDRIQLEKQLELLQQQLKKEKYVSQMLEQQMSAAVEDMQDVVIRKEQMHSEKVELELKLKKEYETTIQLLATECEASKLRVEELEQLHSEEEKQKKLMAEVAKFSETRRKKEEMEARCKLMEIESDNMMQEKAALEEKVKVLEKDKEDMSREAARLTDLLDAERGRFNELLDLKQKKAQEDEVQQKELVLREKQIEDLKKELKTAKDEAASGEKAAAKSAAAGERKPPPAAQSKTKATHPHQHHHMHAKVQNFSAQLKEIDELATPRTTDTLELKKLKEKIKFLEHALEDADAELEDLEDEIDHLEEALGHAQQEIDVLKTGTTNTSSAMKANQGAGGALAKPEGEAAEGDEAAPVVEVEEGNTAAETDVAGGTTTGGVEQDLPAAPQQEGLKMSTTVASNAPDASSASAAGAVGPAESQASPPTTTDAAAGEVELVQVKPNEDELGTRASAAAASSTTAPAAGEATAPATTGGGLAVEKDNSIGATTSAVPVAAANAEGVEQLQLQEKPPELPAAPPGASASGAEPTAVAGVPAASTS
ncbi:unnamed protein product [Amoebophrya sp. A120]|nr:unnamed protein product [Amoebophrya sp. A120]|eukprot:GSA120T00009016001.1